MNISFSHWTTKALALEQLKSDRSSLVGRFGSGLSDLQQEWQGDHLTFSFKAQGLALRGSLAVGEEHVGIEVHLPLTARIFEGRVRQEVLKVMQEVFPDGGPQ
jgi:hypothetical protein